jgi:endo-1,4-beta-xylanase
VWAVYHPAVLDEEARFLKHVAQPNIEKYRKSDARLELADASGHTLVDLPVEVRQTRQAFKFGVSLPFFGEPLGEALSDYEPPAVTQKQLEAVKGVFNYSVIPFSAKWQRIEPVEGERHYEELDKYVDWCVKNGIEIEFHYLSGFTPRWVRSKPVAEQKAAWLRHCRETVARYQDRIKYWQVMNDAYLSQWAGEAVKEIRAKYPHLVLGISECNKFHVSGNYSAQQAWNIIMNGSDELEQLQQEGAKVDFFAAHGHGPHATWFDMRQVYESLDAWAKYGVKIHVTELTLDPNMPFNRVLKDHDAWTPELIADFYEAYYTTLFSHPEVQAINYWNIGPSILRGGSNSGSFTSPNGALSGQAGLLDSERNDAPRPLYHRLKKLITQDWMTRLSTQSGRDGAVAFRGFHGDYEVTVRTADGKLLKGKFTVRPGEGNKYRLKLGEEVNSLATGR